MSTVTPPVRSGRSATDEVGCPIAGGTRLLASAADQLGLALRRERLAEEATSAEVARRGDALKSALLNSVSHDLRTPLATIRAEAGGLMDPDLVPSTEAVRAAAGEIDAQAAHLSDTVRDLLDLGRIEAGELERPDRAPRPRAADRLGNHPPARHPGRSSPGRRRSEPSCRRSRSTRSCFDHALGNVLENAVQHGGPAVSIRWCDARHR